MSFHDHVAQTAVNDGNTTAQFRRAAQVHANGTWMFLLVGAAVWYFVGWKWALIPAAFAAYSALKSISATNVANKLETLERKIRSMEKTATADNSEP